MQLTLLSFGVFGLFFGVVAFVNTRGVWYKFSCAAKNTKAIAKGSLARGKLHCPRKELFSLPDELYLSEQTDKG